MGNTQTNGRGSFVQRLTRSNSQEYLDPRVLEEALAKAAKMHPEIHQHRREPAKQRRHSRRRSSKPYMVTRDKDFVNYFEETEGNEPTDGVVCQQARLEPEMGGVMLLLDSSHSHSTRRRSSGVSMNGSSRRLSSVDKHHIKDISMNGSSFHSGGGGRRASRRVSSQDFVASVPNMSPQEVLRQLEDYANDGMDGADEYLHSLKDLSSSKIQ